MTASMRWAVAALVLVAGAVAAATAPARAEPTPRATPGLQLPEPAGERPVGVVRLELTDRRRADPLAGGSTFRRLVVQLWYPAATDAGARASYLPPRTGSLLETALDLPAGTLTPLRTRAAARPSVARGRHPLLLLSHGLGTLSEFHSALSTELASRGYVVAAIAHTHDAAAVELAGGRVIQGTAPANPTARQRALLLGTRIADLRFVLDELVAGSRARTGLLSGRIATAKVGVLGHSLGGATTAAAMLVDRRIRAGVDLDGSIWGRVAAKGLDRPFMLVVGDDAGGRLTPDQARFFQRLRSSRYALRLRGAGHFTFTDLPLFRNAFPGLDRAFSIGTIDPLRAHQALGDYVSAFFDQSLRHQREPLLDGPSPAYPEVVFLRRVQPMASRRPPDRRRLAP